MERLQAAAEAGDLVAFVGAGVSGIAPTCLPTWWAINQAVLDSLVRESAKVAGEGEASKLAAIVRERQDSGRFPPEFQAELIASKLSGDKYFRVLQCLDGETPNAVHLGLAALAKAGKLRAVVTTNFDRVMEAALTKLGVEFEVAAVTDDFEKLAEDVGSSFDSGPVRVLKLHGSAETAGSLIDTLAQRKQGLPRAIRACLRYLLAKNFWMILGYSGADLAANPNHLCLRAMADTAVGFDWLIRTGEEPPPPVQFLDEAWDDRGECVFGDLPGWLDPLVKGLDVPAAETADEEARRKETAKAVEAHTSEWAAEWGPHRCAVMLADLAEAAGGGKQVDAFLQHVHDSTSEDDRQKEPFAYVCHELARAKMGGAVGWAAGDLEADDPVLKLMQTAHDLLQAAGRELQAGQMQSEMGDYLRHRGNLDGAVEHYEKAKEVVDRVGADIDRAMLLDDMAGIHMDRREYEQALALHREELEIYQKLGRELSRANTLMGIAAIHIHRREYELAFTLIDEAKTIAERLGNDEAIATALNQTAAVHFNLGKHSKAQEIWEEVVAINRRIADPLAEAQARANITMALKKNGKIDEAKAMLLELRDTFFRAGSLEGVAKTYGQLASVHSEAGEYDEAHKLYVKCIEGYEKMNAATAAAPWVRELGVMYRNRQDWETAAKYQQRAMELYEQGGDLEAAGDNAHDLALIAHQQGNKDEARKWAERAVELYDKGGIEDEADDARKLARQFGSDIEAPKGAASGCALLIAGAALLLLV